ncbi:MAG: zinc carboxypeptidase, partial [Bacteroidetes bacterium]|nr:zinc carboxypeptidase [Bacteroidota bacterium]
DPLDREHNEGWPFGRTNHYWFDLNRDWLPLAHIESRNRVEHFHQWLPNVVTDYHEMGSNATYFFEPTKPYGSENPVVPRSNYDQLNNLFAKYFKEALDDIGSLYWTKEVFDNSYPGYGSTYPDIHGGLGLVFEQASSRGHLQRTSTGEITFAFTIRNHLRTSIATVKAGVENRELLLNHQRDFFVDAQNAGKKSPIKAYVAGDADNHNLNQYFLELLLRHNIKCYRLSRTITSGGLSFQPASAILVPTDQPQYLMVRTIFEKVKQFADSVFYDASAWSMALSYGIPHAEVRGSSVSLGDQLSFEDLKPPNRTVNKASYAYLMDWKDYNSPKALYHLLKNGVNAKTAFKPFEASVNGSNKKFGYGSIMVPALGQKMDAGQLHQIVQEAATLGNIDIFSVATGMNVSGIDLGSNNFRTVKKPKAIMVIGEGTSSYETGEVWHLMDTRVGMPITKIDIIDFDRANLNDYTVLILVSGNYNTLNKDKIKTWLEDGGTLIAQRTANTWIVKNELVSENLVEEEKDDEENNQKPARIDFVDARNYTGALAIGGSFYETNIDITHPVAFGYTNRKLTVYKNNKIFLEPSNNPFSTVGVYSSNPWLSGYIHSKNLKKISNSASLIVTKKGRGRVIMFTDNPNFRSMMYGTNKLFLNAVFFGPLINVPSGN